jgi:hypothetical protein
VTAAFNQALQILAADRVVFNEQNFHEEEKLDRATAGVRPHEGATSLGAKSVILILAAG